MRGSLPATDTLRPARLSLPRRLGLGLVFIWFLLGGIAHFAFTPAFMRIVPPGLPGAHAAVLLSGACELLGAFALLSRPWRPAAGIGLALLTVAVTPANVYMWRHAELFPTIAPLWLLLRLPLQGLLLICILWSTRAPAGRRT